MKFQIHHSLLVAQAVVAHLQTMLEFEELSQEERDGLELIVGSFQNCREQGLTVSAYGAPYDEMYSSTCYYIAQNRSSDRIVIYVYRYVFNASEQGIYDNAHYFHHGEYNEAAQFIIDDIVERIKGKLSP